MAPGPAKVRVRSRADETPVQVSLHQDRMLLTTLQVRHAEARGLAYTEAGEETILAVEGGVILAPTEGWGERVYDVIQSKPTCRDGPVQNPLVLAPERKVPTFEGKDTGGRSLPVDEFVTAITHAFDRYSILPHQRAHFLLESLRGNPRIEAKALLSDGAGVEDVLKYLTSSYGESLTSNELQRRLLERRQRPHEGVREFSVELQRLFLRLQKKDAKLYRQPDQMLKELFVDGLNAEGLRHSCRDLLDRRPELSFTELKNWTVQREERESAREVTTSGAVATVMAESSPMAALEKKVEKLEEAVRALTIRPIPHGQPPEWRATAPMHPAPMVHPGNEPTTLQGPLCYNCGRPGHFARNCPAPRQGSSWGRPQSATQYPSPAQQQGNQHPRSSGARQPEGQNRAQ